MNRKGFTPFFTILIILLILIAVYLVMFIPIPFLTKLRTIVNYFLIIILFIIIQVGFVLAYYEIGKFATKGFSKAKLKFNKITNNIKVYIASHS